MSKWDSISRDQYIVTKAIQIEADNSASVLISSHVDDLKVVGESDMDYKVMVLLSVSKQMLNEQAVNHLENSMVYGLLEVGRESLQDHILTAIDLSPKTAAMVEYGKKQLKPTKKRSRK